jgi:hypothetical protein
MKGKKEGQNIVLYSLSSLENSQWGNLLNLGDTKYKSGCKELVGGNRG